MKYRNELPSQEELLRLFEYKDGFIFSKITLGKRKSGQIVGYKNKYGYIVCKIKSNHFYVHRIIWKIVFGDLCGMDIDHINGNKSDNRIENLRLTSRIGNNRNLRSAKSNNKTGLLGASFKKSIGKFVAQIRNGEKYEHIGCFDTAEQAHDAYIKRKREIHETCTI